MNTPYFLTTAEATICILIMLALSSCGSDSNEPSTDKLKEAAHQFLPGHLELIDFKVDAEKNEWNEVNPIYVHGFTTNIRARESAYSVDRRIGDVEILKEEMPEGYTATLYGVS